jgi:hypothetical protein
LPLSSDILGIEQGKGGIMKNPKKLLVPIFLCLFLLAVYGVKGKDCAVVEVTITVVEGIIICDPDPAYARFGEKVVWKSNYEFTIDFGDKTPLKKKVLSAIKTDGEYKTNEQHGEVTTKEAKIKRKKITFKYSIEVRDGNGKVWTVDPDLGIIP